MSFIGGFAKGFERGENLRLCDALGISSGDVVAFVGAGGKSSSIRTIAAELSASEYTVISLATTKMTENQAEAIGPVFVSEDVDELYSQIEANLKPGTPVVAGSGVISKGRIGGLDYLTVERLSKLADVTLVEADGARGLPLKGTADHEPAIPDCTTIAVGVAGIEAFGKPANSEYIHRPELFSVQTGVGPGHSITARSIARAVADGSLADLPDGVRPAALLTGVEPGLKMSEASVIARELWRFGIDDVVLVNMPEDGEVEIWNP